MVKMDAIAVDKKQKHRYKTELTNLKVGKQDPKLFEVPAGYEKRLYLSRRRRRGKKGARTR